METRKDSMFFPFFSPPHLVHTYGKEAFISILRKAMYYVGFLSTGRNKQEWLFLIRSAKRCGEGF